MMKNLKMKCAFLGASMGLLMIGCVDEKGKATTAAENKATPHEDSPVQMADVDPNKDFAVDIIQYGLNSKDLGTWTKCLESSSWAAKIQNGTYTFLCPTDNALSENGRTLIRELLRPENKNLLDKTIAKHLIKGQFRFNELMTMREVETIDGQMLPVNKDAGTVGGVKAGQRWVGSNSTYILVINDIIDYPETELKSSYAKRSKSNGAK